MKTERNTFALKRFLNDAELEEIAMKLNEPFDEIKAGYLDKLEREKRTMAKVKDLHVPHAVGHIQLNGLVRARTHA